LAHSRRRGRGVAAVANDAGHAAAHLLGAVFAEELADQAAQADGDRVGDAVMNGADFDSPELEIAKNQRQVGHVARQAIEGFHDQDVELRRLGVFDQRLDAISTEDRRAGFRAVGIGLDDGKALAMGEGAADGELVLNGPIALKISRKPGVDRRSAAGGRGHGGALWRTGPSRRHDPPGPPGWQEP